MTTKGEYRVGVSFNPSQSAEVDIIKAFAAKLIDAIDALPEPNGEVSRLKALAMTGIEESAMWAVKAATKPEPPADAVWVGPPRDKIALQTHGNAQSDPLFEATVREVVTEVFGVWEGSYGMAPPQNAEMRCIRGMERRGFRGVKPDDFSSTWRAMLKREGK